MKYNKAILLTLFAILSCGLHAQGVQEKSEMLKAADQHGFIVTIVSMSVVFITLILLYLFFKFSGKVAFSLSKKRVMKVLGLSKEEARTIASESGEIYAAIAMALTEVMDEDHDDEEMVLTLKNVTRNYSPWSSKIYTLRELPKR